MPAGSGEHRLRATLPQAPPLSLSRSSLPLPRASSYGGQFRRAPAGFDDAQHTHVTPSPRSSIPSDQIRHAQELPPPKDDQGKVEEDVTEGDETVEVAEGIPVLPRPVDGRKWPRTIFVLERACLEVGKVGKTMQILNSDDHANN